MNNDLVSVELTVADEEKLLRALFKHGVKMPVQCNEGFCGTCVCKSNPSQFNEVHDQLGLLDSEDNVLPCAVRAKEGVNKVVVELPAHLVPEHLSRLSNDTNSDMRL